MPMTQEQGRQAILGIFDPQEDSAPSPSEIPKTTGEFWDSLPDADPKQAAPSSNASAASNFWDSLPDAPAQESVKQPVSYAEDLGKTLVGSTLPRGIAGAAMMGPNLANLPGQIAGWGINKYGKDPFTGKPLTDQQRHNLSNIEPIYSSEHVLQAGADATGLPHPYDPQWTANKYIDTAGQFLIGGKAFGAAVPAASMSNPQLITAGIGAQAGSQLYPNNPIAPLVGAALGGGGAAGFGKTAEFAKNKIGMGEKTEIAPNVKVNDYQLNKAAQNIYDSASNPEQVVADTGEQGRASPDIQGPMPSKAAPIIEGSNPTLAEVTPDMGIAQHQDTLRTKYPKPFQQIASDQNESRANSLNNVRGQGNPESFGAFLSQQLRDEDAAMSGKEQTAFSDVSGKGVALGKYGEFPEKGLTNDVIQNAQKVRGESESKAWGFLEPYKESRADKAPVLQTAQTLLKGVNSLAGESLSPVEERLYTNIAQQWPENTINFDTLKKMRSSIGEAQGEVQQGSQAMRRLQMLKNSVDQSVENTVNGIVAHEQQAVAAGHMLPETGLMQQVNDWYNSKYSGERQLAAGAGGSVYVAKTSARGPRPISSISGTKGHAGRESAGLENGKRSAQAPESLKFGEEQKQQYESARTETFRNKTLGNLENSGAVNPDGTLDAKKYDRWYSKNSKRLNTFPKFREELSDWRNAQESLNGLRSERAAKEAEFNKSRLSQIINATEPEKVIGKIFNSDKAQSEFADLVQRAKGDHAALDGLKAAAGEHILKVARADIAEEGSSLRSPQAFRDFLRNHNRSLKIVFGGQGLQNLEAIGADIRRTQQWNKRAKIAGQSNTAKDTAQLSQKENLSILGKLMAHADVAGALIGKLSGHGAGEGLGIGMGIKMLNGFRSAGLKNIEQIELEMVKNPAFAHEMLKKIAAKEIPIPVQKRIAATLVKPMPVAASYEQNSKIK